MAKRTSRLLCVGLVLLAGDLGLSESGEPGWISLFDGESLNGWKASENKATFSVQDGRIVAKGPRSHLFYVGPVDGASFKNFEFKADVMTKPGSNSGMYIHTEYQETGWPNKGYEVQVNNTHSDWRKTGGLYAVKDVRESPASDNEWFTQHIIVKGKQITIKVNGKTTVDYTEPDKVVRERFPGRKLSSGTFALQGHDPDSIIYYKNIMVKPLPDDSIRKGEWVSLFDGKTLNSWEQVNGTAKYEVKDAAIIGTTAKGSPNSFLCTKKHYSDFELEFEVKLDSRLNSGVQIRSNSFPEYRKGRVHGYQVEISTNGNAGFIYDEARRGWLSKDRSDEEARRAFRNGQWNKYHVLCVGDTIKTWVNHVPVAHVVDPLTRTGFIGLQVHSFKGDPPAWAQWRNLRIRELKARDAEKRLKVVVVTGGHGFEREPFFGMLDAMEQIDYVESLQKDHSELFEDISGWDYDVVVFYNMTQEISEKRRQNLLKLLNKGVGVVALHHTLGAYQGWPEFKKIIGGKYYLKDTTEDGVEHKQGAYKHDLDVKVYVKNKKHPITQGMSDFVIHDETYKNVWHDKGNQVLITTDHETSDETIGWVKDYRKARVCTIQLGHDAKAYNNWNYRELLRRAILWTAGRL